MCHIFSDSIHKTTLMMCHMNNQTSTRLSGVQKDILFVLYGLTERKNIDGPLPAMTILELGV